MNWDHTVNGINENVCAWLRVSIQMKTSIRFEIVDQINIFVKKPNNIAFIRIEAYIYLFGFLNSKN